MVKKNLSFIASLLLALMLASCAVNPVTGKKELMFVSESSEVDMGREVYPSAIWAAEGGGGKFGDERLTSYLSDIIIKIHGVSHRPHLPVEFAIQNSSVPNAWAIPGHVVMTRGLLASLKSEAEFAFVMGHEMGHVSARHSARQMTYGMLQQVALGGAGMALGDRAYTDAALAVGAAGTGLILLKYGRGDELESDGLGMLYMTRLGYDPDNAIRAHQNLEKASDEYLESIGKEPHERSFFEDLLSTHPRTSVRIEELEKMKDALPPFSVKGDGAGKARFMKMTAGLRVEDKIYRDHYDNAVRAFKKGKTARAAELVDGAIEADASQPPFHVLSGFIKLKKKEYGKARRSFDRALELDRDYQPAWRGMGALHYHREDYGEAIKALSQALKTFPQDYSSHHYLGFSYYKTERYKKAIPHLKAFASVRPKDPEVHGMLGICYEVIREFKAAYNEYIRQLRVEPDSRMGRYAARRVEALRPVMERQRR
ncbi:MAG: M48 family metalloprotease [Thermodesulfobacteriota bacterium]